MRSTKLWVKAHNPASKWLYISLGLTSIAGLIDATYLTITHYTKALVPCSVTHGCETVLRSSYAEVLGVPIAAFGIVFYLVVLVVSVQSYFSNRYTPLLPLWAAIGFLSTLYLLYIQAFVLHAWCQYCLLSAATSTVIFGLGMVLWMVNNGKNNPAEKNE